MKNNTPPQVETLGAALHMLPSLRKAGDDFELGREDDQSFGDVGVERIDAEVSPVAHELVLVLGDINGEVSCLSGGKATPKGL